MQNTIIVDKTIEVARNACSLLYSQQCCQKLIDDLDYQNKECMAQFMAKTLGYGIILGASLVKLPQVLKIYSAKSGTGITLLGVIMELLAITFNASYSYRNKFPISAWGEAISLAFETALIAFMILFYSSRKMHAILFASAFAGLGYTLSHPTLISRDFLWYTQSSVLPLAVTGKLIQVVKNIRAGNTGQMSAISAWLIFLGSAARVFTTIQETGDKLTAVTFAAASTVNCLLALQVLYYWKATNKYLEAARKRKDC